MKYVMFETENGQKLPVLFPEALTHSLMAMCIAAGIEVCINSKAKPVSAGFVNLGIDTKVHGKSESMGNLESHPSDAAYIVVGDSIAFMPDAMASMMFERLQEVKGG